MAPVIDHLVFGSIDLERASSAIRDTLNAEPVEGGQHAGWGTMNRLVGLGPSTYLEVIGADPDQNDPAAGRPFGIDGVDQPRLVGWAVRVADLDETIRLMRHEGFETGDPFEMERDGPAATVLRWRLTPPHGGAVPFLIDWGSTPHPAGSLDHSLTLASVRLESPDPAPLRRLVKAVGLPCQVRPGFEERLVATIDTPTSRLVLW